MYLAELSSTGPEDTKLVSQREAILGIAAAQNLQLAKTRVGRALIRILLGNAGESMNQGEKVVGTLRDMMARDPSIVGVVGLDQSREPTVRTIRALTRIGLTSVAATLSADSLATTSPNYFQISPPNSREAEVVAAYAAQLSLPARSALVLVSTDSTDTYSLNLAEDTTSSLVARGFTVESAPYQPGVSTTEARARACAHRGLVVFPGRAEDFEEILASMDDRCHDAPPPMLAGDDVSRFVAANPQGPRKSAIPYDYASFAVGASVCNAEGRIDSAAEPYKTMSSVFGQNCQEHDLSLDGHASLTFDAVRLYLEAMRNLGREYELDLGDAAQTYPVINELMPSALGGTTLVGSSGRISFVAGQRVPDGKSVTILRVTKGQTPARQGFCDPHLPRQSSWCPVATGS